MSEGKNLVGVDIGSSSIKVCQLKEGRKGYGLVRLGYAPLPPQTIVDGHVMNSQAVIEGLNRLFAEAKIKQKEVALSISGQAVIIRKITVPMMTAAELDEQIQWEAEQHIPFDIKDVHVDYEVLRRRPEAGQMDLLLVAAKRDEINDYTQIAKSAKLKPLVVDIDAFTVQNLFEMNRGIPPDQTFAIINVGASLASINIVSRGASAFTRDIANGGNYITEQIQKQLGVPFEQAEEFKCASATGAPGSVPALVPQVIDAGRDPALSRLLPRDERRSRGEPDLPDRRLLDAAVARRRGRPPEPGGRRGHPAHGKDLHRSEGGQSAAHPDTRRAILRRARPGHA